ncbi:HD domain-containing phosphohydrolase [Hydrogenimonas sp.]
MRPAALEILGAAASPVKGEGMTSLLLSPSAAIDAGNLVAGLRGRKGELEHLFLTHSHLDHIVDIPFYLDTTFGERRKSLTIYGTPETLHNIRTHLFCDEIWTDYTRLTLPASGEPAVRMVPLAYGERVALEGVRVTPIRNLHTEGSCAFLVETEEGAVLFSSDTGYYPPLAETIAAIPSLRSLVFELSYPDEMAALAEKTRHLTPRMLAEMLRPLEGLGVPLYLQHLKAPYADTIAKEAAAALAGWHLLFLRGGDRIRYADGRLLRRGYGGRNATERFGRLVEIGRMMGTEENETVFSEVLETAMDFLQADGGSLYALNEEENALRFCVVRNRTLGIDGRESGWPDIPLAVDGRPNDQMVAAAAALRGETINIPDVYDRSRYNFSGPKRFDEKSGYHTRSMLVVPMKDRDGKVIGVMQLINKIGPDGEPVPFDREDEAVAEGFAALAGMVLRNYRLALDLERMIESFMTALARALDTKSPNTGRHIERMVALTEMLAEAYNARASHPFSPKRMHQIHLAALVHDIGKIVTPDYLLEKRWRLETLFDRFECIRLRAELAKAQAACDGKADEVARLADETVALAKRLNSGREPYDPEAVARLHDLAASLRVEVAGERLPVVTREELEALSIRYGTLDPEERRIVMEHVRETQKILGDIHYPSEYESLPEIAGNHHERLDGSGYPLRLKAEAISPEARILAVADIFEALTAPDRPYKHPHTVEEAETILREMADEGKVDAEVVEALIEEGVGRRYAEEFLKNPRKEATISRRSGV